MTTWVDLILKFLNSIFDSKLKLSNLQRDKRDRIANYFEEISKTLIAATVEFENGERPWDKYREVSHYLDNFFEVVGDSIKDEDLMMSYIELFTAANSDFALLGGSRERTIVDAITVRPLSHRHYMYDLPSEQNKHLWDAAMEKVELDRDAMISQEESPAEKLTEQELKQILTNEIDRIKEASGLFKALAVQLRTTD